MSIHEVRTTHIGSMALGLLVEEQSASVIGVTSRGLFLRLSSAWVVFISPEVYRGPLTLNYSVKANPFGHITNGEKAGVYPGRIIFPAAGVVIDTQPASPWQAPALPTGLLPPAECKAKLALVAGLVHARQPASLLAGLLPILTGIEQQPIPHHVLTPQVEGLRCALAERHLTGIVSGLAGFFGLGSGLTPSGDDLVSGFLLALARWGHLLVPQLRASELARPLLPLAYQKTTTLSANLLECACLGQADERLLLALDGIITSAPDPPACAAALAAWGNTSGHDALVGMALVLQDRCQAG